MKNNVCMVYDNYDLFSDEAIQEVKNWLLECDYSEDEITDNIIYSYINDNDADNWETARTELENFFSDKYRCIIFGVVGRWNGTFAAGTIFDGDEIIDILNKALRDCDYISITDENGHLYISGTHHDGTVCYEVKILTDRGVEYLGNWDYAWNDKRTEQYVHNQIVKRYSVLPHFTAKVYGYGVKATV